jgi:spore maturation protein B
MGQYLNVISISIIPMIISIILIHASIKDIDVYDVFVEGAKEGFETAIKIMPYLIAVFLAIGIFKVSGMLNGMINLLLPLCEVLGIPKEVLPLIIMRPISGSGSLGIVQDIITTYGPDSFIGRLASTMMGSAETIFYTMAVYFGSIGIKKARHTLLAALISHIASVFASILICKWIFLN